MKRKFTNKHIAHFLIISFILFGLGFMITDVFAQVTAKKETKVGNPSTSSPTTGAERVSCPLQGRRVIGCGSFMSDAKYNRGVCNGPQPIDRGHCGRTYGECFKGNIEDTRKQRWAQSIDVDAPAGEKLYFPTIDGQTVQWTYVEGSSYAVPPKIGGGWGHGFVATVGTDKWIMYTVHMNPLPLIPPPNGKSYQSGDPFTTVAATSYTHLHMNIGKNPTGDRVGEGWLSPENVEACTN